MSPRARAALAAALLAVACAKERPAPPLPKNVVKLGGNPITDDTAERNDLASLVNGGTVIDRSGETMLEFAAVNAIDSDPDSQWTNPPHDLPQSITIALPARSEVASVGFRTMAKDAHALKEARVESSIDGAVFSPLANVTLKAIADAQFFNVPATTARQLRVTILSGYGKTKDVKLNSLLVRGKELEPVATPEIGGTWRINGREATFIQHGTHVDGLMAVGAHPMMIEGGCVGNRLFRFAWMRGNDYGIAAATVSGNRLSGVSWHEEAIPLFLNEAWLGEKSAGKAAALQSGEQFAIAYLRRTGRWPLFGGDVDALAKVITNAPVALQLVAHEFREATPAANRARAERQLAGLREALKSRGVDLGKLQFVVAGSDKPRQQPVNQIMRELYSTVDLEIRR